MTYFPLDIWSDYWKTGSRTHRNLLIVYYAPLVQRIAKRLARMLPTHIGIDDLTSCGNFGLIDAIERFDPRRDTSFETYATYRVRGAMIDAIRANDPVPRSVRAADRTLLSQAEFLQMMGTPTPRLRRMVEEPADPAAGPVELFEAKETAAELAVARRGLDQRHRFVVELYYYQGKTLAEIAEILGVSQTRISQIRSEAVTQIGGSIHAAGRDARAA